MSESRLIAHGRQMLALFEQDGRLERNEIEVLICMATEDGVVEEEEKVILGEVFQHAEKLGVGDSVKVRIEELKDELGI